MRYNPYLTKGFNHAWIDDETGQVFAAYGKEMIAVFPNDQLGDYFYMRTPQRINFSEAKDYKMVECLRGTAVSGQVILVACVRDADSDQLVHNLANTLQSYSSDLMLNSAIFQSEFVMLQELAKMKEENISAALARIKPDMTFVSLTFTMRSEFQYTPLQCMTKPCKKC